jgi:replicative DNA helicase
MGKTALMMAIADNLSIRRFNSKTGVIFSLEMSEQELINRLISRRTKINAQNLDNGDLTEDQQARVYEEAALIKRAPLYVNDSPGLAISQMLAEATRIKMLHGLDYVMVDYLQLAESHSRSPLYEKVSKIARDLKNMSKYLEVPVFALSQLSRSVENRQDKRPILSDLRDSGQIEEAGDIIVSLFRAEYYEVGVRPNIVEANVLKHRGGPTGIIELYFDGPCITMHNLAKEDPLTGRIVNL